MKFYQQSKEKILNNYNVKISQGLSETQVIANRERYGENKLPEEKEDSYLKVFLKSFKEPIIIVLMGAVALSFFSSFYSFQIVGDRKHGLESLYEAIAIAILIIINAFLGFWQEISARKNLNSLKEMNNRFVSVLRNGNLEKIASNELVVGDIVKVTVGDFVEADVRWLQLDELQLIESHLTGEADAVIKTSEIISEKVEIGDQRNMGFSGSVVSSGQGTGIVVATGENTELGKISQLMKEEGVRQSPLQKTVQKLTKTLMKISAGIVVLTFVFGLISSGEFSINSITSVFSTSIALAVASIPDALPVVLSIVLTIGAVKMSKNKGLIKTLSSVETLGSTSYICSDKTGTLTQNEMTVTKFYANGQLYTVEGLGYDIKGGVSLISQENKEKNFEQFMESIVLCNDSSLKEVEGQIKTFGNPTEIALTVLGAKTGYKKDDLLEKVRVVRTLPFSSSRKMMSVIIENDRGYFLYTKGAPDVLIERCSGFLINNQIDKSEKEKDNFVKIVDTYAEEALRTLAVAYKKIDENEALNGNTEELEKDFILTGVAGIIDPPREEVKESIRQLHEANINVVMITGDHEKTARAIAYDLGIVKSKDAKVLKGIDLEEMSDQELYEEVRNINVYARVSPEHKQRIVKQLQSHKQVVAMTGDGVNDAPALRAADIGVAMGITGTEVTKDSADLILLDDKFTTIEKSVYSGRTIYANIKNFMRHELTTNVAEVLALILGLVLFRKAVGDVAAMTPTLTALMVLWVNMVSDAIPSFSLGYDVAETDLMKEKPRDSNQSILANYTWSRVLIRGTIMGGMVYLSFLLAAQNGLSASEAQTVAFLTLVYGQLWHVFDARSSRTLFRRNPFGNLRLVGAVVFAGVSSFLVTLIPFFNSVMGTAQLTLPIYLMVIFIPALPTLILSGVKEIFKVKIW
ncbi:cation-translocating P-type ATPase [Lactococcus cremoris]|uniref:Cation-transporting ATPase n=2 Tax=Lactococcus lactis subsp. cremoris TaxID=1359 RepID=A0A084AEQ3_LACLC|nr:cation-transporting P-type ATPase [Lactococcus cremoris]KEY63782.1 Cation-transporting ATPase [Lactococcus cremoris subsp. cremoris GE214]KKW74098.1 calcium-transporting P-type ATPase, PMR1-type [Lactococcus cremoris]TNU77117.1 cation-transporting P-type ATPase [Lactococcus cremoris]